MSFAVQPRGNWPSTFTSMFLLFFCSSVCVASTCSTSDVPMPCASAPNAPCVDVCESPQTIVMPGSVAPCSGPMMCTMPWRRSFILNCVMPKESQFASSVSTCSFEIGSAMPCERSVVGTLWSDTARFALMRHTGRSASFSPSNACGLVTSCSR